MQMISSAFIMNSLACLMHPHHISLIDTHSLRAKLQHAGDPYYNVDGLPSHHGVLAPKFDVFEIHSATLAPSSNPSATSGDANGDTAALEVSAAADWLVVGELPGLKMEDIKIEWLDGTTVFVCGKLSTTSFPGLAKTEGFGQIEHLKALHKERQERPFERSVTMPAKADVGG